MKIMREEFEKWKCPIKLGDQMIKKVGGKKINRSQVSVLDAPDWLRLTSGGERVHIWKVV